MLCRWPQQANPRWPQHGFICMKRGLSQHCWVGTFSECCMSLVIKRRCIDAEVSARETMKKCLRITTSGDLRKLATQNIRVRVGQQDGWFTLTRISLGKTYFLQQQHPHREEPWGRWPIRPTRTFLQSFNEELTPLQRMMGLADKVAKIRICISCCQSFYTRRSM